MKTLAVLSALVALAIAAPALEDYSDRTNLKSNDFTIIHREKKSTQPETLVEKTLEHLEDHASTISSNKFGTGSSIARTFSGFKKPIIVKKKIGYQVYRDSDEEQAQIDSRESCKEPIKVKLCDENNSVDKMKAASIHQTHEELSESEMKHSINMAKEAVEAFQRDLKKIENENIGQRHTPLGADKELHEDIEKARQALEHIQRKFNNFDTNSDTDEGNGNSKMSLTGDENMAQWKESLDSHKDLEIGKNLEDRFKVTKTNSVPVSNEKSSSAIDKDFKSITVEDIDTHSSSELKKVKDDDGMISVIEDIIPKERFHSDSLKKEKNTDEDEHQTEETLKTIEKTVEDHNELTEKTMDNITTNAQENKERGNEDRIKSTQSDKLEIQEKHMWNKMDDKDMLKSSMDRSNVDLESKLRHGNLQTMNENKNKEHETMKNIRSEELSNEPIQGKNDKNDSHGDQNEEQRSTLLKQSSTNLNSHISSHMHDNMKNEFVHLNSKTLEHDAEEKGLKSTGNDMDTQRSSLSMTAMKLKDENNYVRNETPEKDDKNIHEHELPTHTRASSDFHKKLLNNMEFVDDSHQIKHSSTEAGHHLLKIEKPELHERFNVPHIQANSDHLKSMMHLSDNSQDINQRAQLKMSTMFNNEQPNLNVQFNSPQTFQEQTNVEGMMPFKAATDFHDKHFHTIDTMEDKHGVPADLHDPLETRWAHENHMEKLKSVSQLHTNNMEMDGSSSQISIDRSMPLRSSLTNGQLNGHQRWGQGKNVNTGLSLQNHHGSEISQHLSSMRNNFEHHHHDASTNEHLMMMHGKSNTEGLMQPNNFMHMRGSPKMALEYAGPNQWNHNHGAYRSSYGPSSYGSASYGSGGSSASGGAVGVFPNANVGNCAVPLLLSCSPSVVSGSLAKANTYSAPSYRSEDINFLKKRDTDIFQGHPGFKALEHKPNNNLVLENKH